MSTTRYIIAGVAGALLIFFGVWYFFFYTPLQNTTTPPNSAFGTSNSVTTNVVSNTQTNETQPIGETLASSQKIFKIADGPVTGATFVQFTRPTTTLVRFITADNGHVFDMTIDSPGAVAHTVSNTTIPGSVQSLWGQNGKSVILQYFDNTIIKTLSMTFPPATTTSTTLQPARIKFFPDNVSSIALSPDGTQAAYVLKNPTGIDGYISNPDGGSSKKIFTLALSQVLVSWPSQNTLLLQTKSASGVPGMVFSVDVKNGGIVSLLYANGVTATADRTFTHIVYQMTQGETASTYVRDTKKGSELSLSFNPMPEKCIWSTATTSTLYCAGSLQAIPQNYIDLWHMGTVAVADSIFSYNLSAGQTAVAAVPGSDDGGQQTSIDQIQVSADGHYLLYITKGDRSLWGVRLTQ